MLDKQNIHYQNSKQQNKIIEWKIQRNNAQNYRMSRINWILLLYMTTAKMKVNIMLYYCQMNLIFCG